MFQYNVMPPCSGGVHYLHDANIMKDLPGGCYYPLGYEVREKGI